MPNLVTYPDQTPKCEWQVISCGSNNTLQKDLCLEKIGLRSQDVITFHTQYTT